MREKKLLLAFGIFLILTITIGSTGIYQIYNLTDTIQNLGQRHLPRERLVLKIKINNALYTSAVRNYVNWRISRYLQLASTTSDIKAIEKILLQTKQYLRAYEELTETDQQKQWVEAIADSIAEMTSMGNKLIAISDGEGVDKEKMNKLLMVFENRIGEMDELLTETISKSNLQDIEKQLRLTMVQRDLALSILFLSLCFSIVLTIAISFIVYKSLKKERLHREFLVQKMIRMEEEEHKNLSRQVHDQLGQDLSALKIYLELIEKGMPEGVDDQKEKIEKSRKLLVSLIDKGHNISELLRPPELDDLGIVESIEGLVDEHRQITGAQVVFKKPEKELVLALELSLTLYRAVQEGLTNIGKYAKAGNVLIELGRSGREIFLAIEDDGAGFNYKDYLKKPQRRKEDMLKLGLRGLRERVELLGGKFAVKTAPQKGTKIIIKLPLGRI